MSAKKTLEISKAIELRLTGKSLNYIAKTLGVAKSSVSGWVRNVIIPEEFKIKKPEKPVKVKKPLKVRRISQSGHIMVKAPSEYGGKIYHGGWIYEHRYLMEKHLGRYLTSFEVVHHKDHNKMNNSIDNLEVLSGEEHSKIHGEHSLASYVEIECPVCSKIFKKRKNKTHLVRKNYSATYCSRRCSGKSKGFSSEQIAKSIVREFKE